VIREETTYYMSPIFDGTQPGTETRLFSSQTGTGKAIPEMLLFDIDGVITQPVTGEVELEVVNEIVAILERGEPVAFNTGRGLNWVLRDILPHFEARISERNVISRLCIVYQKGAFRITFNEKGEQEQPVTAPGILLIPNSLRAEVLQLIATKYAETMFPGEEKEAMLSPQFRPGTDFMQYKVDQKRLVDDLQALLQRYNLASQFKVDPTRIATDIEDKHLGKALGAQQVLIWLKEQGLQPQYFITFGDSKSDVGMAEEIYRQGLPVELVFVGEKSQLQGMQLPFPISFTEAFCEKGTVEYLKNRVHRAKH
jgi:hydroxymethylpyrimidine pyrophosphatase-like HAD family hydrolase